MSILRYFEFAFLLLALLLVDSSAAYAYLDSGTINMVLQAIGAAIVGGLVGIKVFWYKIVMFFKNIRKSRK